MPQSFDIIIIGGGTIGLSLAWRLQQGGASVAVFDGGRFLRSPSDPAPQGQATAAAAGMLAPFVGASTEGPLLQLALDSFRLWPAFSQELGQLSDVEVPLEGKGVLRVAMYGAQQQDGKDSDGSRPHDIHKIVIDPFLQFQEKSDFSLRVYTPELVLKMEPAVSGNNAGGLFSPLERQVQPRLLLQALTAAVERAGGCLCDATTVGGFVTSGDEVLSVETSAGQFRAGQFVLAAGAWTGPLAENLHVTIPIRPMRGQMLALEAPNLITHALFAEGGCLIPQADGRVLVGSTEEDAGFQSDNTAAGLQKLIRFAANLVPALADKPLHSTWSGLRPAAADGLPVMGAVPGWRNLHIASGHFRKGILLTPITAEWMSNSILRQECVPGMDAFSPARFLG